MHLVKKWLDRQIGASTCRANDFGGSGAGVGPSAMLIPVPQFCSCAAPPAWPFIETSPSGGLCWREEADKHFNRPREKLCETWISLSSLFADAQPDESFRDESQTASGNEVVFVHFFKKILISGKIFDYFNKISKSHRVDLMASHVTVNIWSNWLNRVH